MFDVNISNRRALFSDTTKQMHVLFFADEIYQTKVPLSQIYPTKHMHAHARIQEFSSGGVQVSLTKKL